MKNAITKDQDTFQNSIKILKALIAGANMAKISVIICIAISLKLMFYSEKNLLVIISLSLGIATLIVYIIKFLLLKNIKQKSYTQNSLTSSISKFKTYMARRKNNEIYYLSIWAISVIPIISILVKSTANACINTIIFLILMNFIGRLGFKKTDRTLKNLETVLQIE